MALNEADQQLKDIAAYQSNQEFIRLSIALAGDLRKVFYNAQALLTKWFEEQYGTTLSEEDFKEFSIDLDDLTTLMGAIQSIATAAQDPANQWIGKVTKVARSERL